MRRSKPPTPLQQRELELRRDIAEAYFNAQSPIEVYRLALARVTPLIAASFSSVFLRDPTEPELLRLVCAHNWPQSSARFLGQLRIRTGRGPTGRAVAERRPIEVSHVFADLSLRDWWEPARELGFASLISLPLEAGRCMGALTFYYDRPHEFNDDERQLLSLIAGQLSITAERAGQTQELQLENQKLREQAESLTARVGQSEEMQRLKTEFLSNISHELRTPLTSILGYSYLLLEGQNGHLTDAQAAALRKIDGSANVLLQLINDLLALTELKLGRSEVVAIPEDAVLIARRAAEKAEPSARVRFSIEASEERVPIQTDVEKILRILENLLSNAFKFTKQGEVVLSVRRLGFGEQQRIEWTVRDTGIGIPRELLPTIFDEFRQVDGSSTRLYGGTGLGLSLCLHLTRLLGGEIMVESDEGRGSTFTLRLPATYPGSSSMTF
ncbi:MAG: GAF domain-containing sensor histidine kinase [Gemmatimonadota bacterium]